MRTPDDKPADEEMLPDYDFTGGIRGKHYKAYRADHTVNRSDGTTEQQHVTAEPGTVELAPDVQVYFPDSESVNRVLRGLIRLVPKQAEQE